LRGRLLWFNTATSNGRISTDDGEEFVVHGSGFLAGHVPPSRCAGTPVSFERREEAAEGEAFAIEVAIVEELPPRRARRRSGGHARW
jgi:cold shock CspA family protein